MKALAGWIMAGRMQAIMAATVAAMLAIPLAPLGIVAAAVIALVTLRRGVTDGVVTSAGSMLALGLLGALIFQQGGVTAGIGLALFLPMLVLAGALRATVQLRLSVELAVLFAGLMLGAQYALLADPAAFWSELLNAVLEATDPQLLAGTERAQLVAAVARWIPGALAAGWFLHLILGLLLGRWWQAQLYNPGGFAGEFRQLRLGRWLSLLLPVLVVLGWGQPGNWSQLLALPVAAAFVLQGLAMAHALVTHFKANQGWLFGLYLLVGLTGWAGLLAVAAGGYLDSWLDLRRRAGIAPGGPGEQIQN